MLGVTWSPPSDDHSVRGTFGHFLVRTAPHNPIRSGLQRRLGTFGYCHCEPEPTCVVTAPTDVKWPDWGLSEQSADPAAPRTSGRLLWQASTLEWCCRARNHRGGRLLDQSGEFMLGSGRCRARLGAVYQAITQKKCQRQASNWMDGLVVSSDGRSTIQACDHTVQCLTLERGGRDPALGLGSSCVYAAGSYASYINPCCASQT
jgi:hypothetical protein